MQDPDKPVIILDPGEERAQHIARALSSRTAGKILDILSDGPRSLSYIAENLDIPLPKAKYHITNLLDAGILEIAEERYSVKGRRIKIYGLKHQILVVAPRMVNLRAMLLEYSSVFGIFLCITLVIAAIGEYYRYLQPPPLLGGGSLEPAPPPSVLADPALVLVFFLGGCLVVGALLIGNVLLARVTMRKLPSPKYR